MSYMLAAIVLNDVSDPAPIVNKWRNCVQEAFGCVDVGSFESPRFSVVICGNPGAGTFGVGDCGLETDGDGLVRAWCGVVVDPEQSRENARSAPTAFDRSDALRLEGAYGAVSWDEKARRGFVFNDHASMMNLYVVEHTGILWITTSAVPLARALGLGLDPDGVRELMARGSLLAPTTMFEGMRRLGVGEHISVKDGVIHTGVHWSPYREVENGSGIRESAERLADAIKSRVRLLAAGREPVVADLSGGLDSRLVVAALDASGVNFDVMTYGHADSEDVLISRNMADSLGFRSRYFRPEEFLDRRIDDQYRTELLYRTAGELPFPAVFHGSLFRRELAANHGLHLSGSTGELTRYFPWSQEFFGIGRHRPANVSNALRYRFLQGGMPVESMFCDSWSAAFVSRLSDRIAAVCAAGSGTATTSQMDAVYLWKMTSHASLFISATFGYLPNLTPLGMAGVLDVCLSIPWTQKLTTMLNRLTNQILSPRVAAFRTSYGGTGAPPSLSTIHMEAGQAARQIGHLVSKVERVAFRGIVSKRFKSGVQTPPSVRPYLSESFRQTMEPSRMLSRSLYRSEFLDRFMSGSDIELSAREPWLSRVATVELLCREIGFQPEPGFLLK